MRSPMYGLRAKQTISGDWGARWALNGVRNRRSLRVWIARRYVYSSYYLLECVHCMERHYGETEKRTGAVVEACAPTSSADGRAVNYIIGGH